MKYQGEKVRHWNSDMILIFRGLVPCSRKYCLMSLAGFLPLSFSWDRFCNWTVLFIAFVLFTMLTHPTPFSTVAESLSSQCSKPSSYFWPTLYMRICVCDSLFFALYINVSLSRVITEIFHNLIFQRLVKLKIYLCFTIQKNACRWLKKR